MERFRQEALDIIKGGYDLHTHSSPSHVPRVVDDFTLVCNAANLGMAGVMIKNHYESTGSRAALVNASLPCSSSATAFGGIVLNWPMGGLNPYAVESAVRLGAKMVWMPTRDSAACLTYGNMTGDFFVRPGISILDEAGKLKSSVLEIIDIVGSHNITLATGHLNLKESVALCAACTAHKVKIILTHPEWQRTVVPLDMQIELARSGVKIEKCWINIAEGDCSAEYMAHTIHQIGVDNILLTTDCGKLGQLIPTEGMISFVETLLGLGVSFGELRTMIRSVPASLLFT